jgi:hypothetical protein
MPIKRLKPSSEEELVTHIKNSLTGHEEEYAPGAWEKFNKKEQRRPAIIYWIGGLSSAAAVLLIGFGLVFYSNNEKEVVHGNHDIVESRTLTPSPESATNENNSSLTGGNENSKGGNSSTTRANKRSIAANSRLAQVGKSKTNIASFDHTITAASEPVIAFKESLVTNSIASISPVQPGNDDFKQRNPVVVVTAPNQTSESAKKPLTFEEFLAKEKGLKATGNDKTSKQTADDKWDLGIVVAPSFGNNDKLNMGYGVSMAYNLNSKVSLGSGLSYNEMGASKEIIGNSAPNSPSTNALVSDTKSLQSVNTQVRGIDIPLEIRYNLSGRFYANVGVSAFAVINRQQNNVYLQGTVVQRSAANAFGDLQPQTFLVTEKVSEKAPQAVNANSKLIGFYNFSFGYKQKIGKDKSIGIEPFMKVPMKDVTSENLRLLGTGLKIKFDF